MNILMAHCPERSLFYDILQYIPMIAGIVCIFYFPIRAVVCKEKRRKTGFWMLFCFLMSLSVSFTLVDWSWFMDILNLFGIDFSWAPFGAFCYESNLTFSGIAGWFIVVALSLPPFIYYLLNKGESEYRPNNNRIITILVSLFVLWEAISNIIYWFIGRGS